MTPPAPLAVAAALALAAALAPPGAPAEAPAAAEAPARLADEARRVVEGGAYQQALPLEADDPTAGDRRSPPLGLSLLARALLYALGAAALAGVLVALGRRLRGARWDEVDATPARAPEDIATQHLSSGDADALARAGRFADAVHRLLQGALAGVTALDGRPLGPSLTSREVLAATALAGPPRAALAELVAAVEASLFGGAPVGPDDYARCLAAHRALTRSLGRPA